MLPEVVFVSLHLYLYSSNFMDELLSNFSFLLSPLSLIYLHLNSLNEKKNPKLKTWDSFIYSEYSLNEIRYCYTHISS